MAIELNLAIHSQPQSEAWLGYERYAVRLNEIIELTPEDMSQWITPAKSVSEKILAKLDSQGLPATYIANEVQELTIRNQPSG